MIDKQLIYYNLIQSQQFETAFEMALTDYSKPLYAMIFKILQNHDDTDDALQNTMIKVWQNIQKFKADSSIYTWMFAIAKNEALTVLRKNKKIIRLEEDEIISSTVTNSLGQEQIWSILLDAIIELPIKQKQVFEMKYFEDKTYEEMAAITQTSVGGLKANYHHAVQKIETFIKNKNLY